MVLPIFAIAIGVAGVASLFGVSTAVMVSRCLGPKRWKIDSQDDEEYEPLTKKDEELYGGQLSAIVKQ